MSVLDYAKEFPITAELKGVRFGGRLYTMALPIGYLADLESKLHTAEYSSYYLLSKFVLGKFTVQEVKEVLVHGLLGGGMEFEDVINLLEKHYVSGKIGEYALAAKQVLALAFKGVEADMIEQDNPEDGKKKEPNGLDGHHSIGSAEPQATQTKK